MRTLLYTLITAASLAACSTEADKQAQQPAASEPKTINKQAAIDEAKTITQAFAGNLKGALQKAMKEGGPVNAIKACSTEAMPITAKAANDSGAMVKRVSLKNRNPINFPNDWQKTVLEDFDTRASQGEDIMKMAYANIVEDQGKKTLRFMKALPTGDVCLNCHGVELKPEVQAKLKALYPDDKATGYTKGQVRGAIVVIKELD